MWTLLRVLRWSSCRGLCGAVYRLLFVGRLRCLVVRTFFCGLLWFVRLRVVGAAVPGAAGVRVFGSFTGAAMLAGGDLGVYDLDELA